jgi:hypothetical protein
MNQSTHILAPPDTTVRNALIKTIILDIIFIYFKHEHNVILKQCYVLARG